MKRPSFVYIVLTALLPLVIVLLGAYELPKYASRLVVLAALVVADMLYWIPVKKRFSKNRYFIFWKILYWLPLVWLLMWLWVGVFRPIQEWPRFMQIYFPAVFMILFIGKAIAFLSLLIGDAIRVPLTIIKRVAATKPVKNVKRFWGLFKIGIAVALLFGGLFIAGMFVWVNDVKVNVVEIPIKELPVEFDGYRIAQLSDIHSGNFFSHRPLKKALKLLNEAHPDVLCFTGDMVTLTTKEVFPFEATLKQFNAKDGAYAILGNHDYGEYTQWPSLEAKKANDQALFDFYKRIGWRLLRNQNQVITRGNIKLAIIGVENWSVVTRYGKKGDIAKAMAGADSVQLYVLLTHDPSHWDAQVRVKYPQIQLTLSGHTHAFQMAVETTKIKWSPSQFLFKEWAGLYAEANLNGNKQYLYVNRGLGTIGYPGRIFTRPEITVLVLKRGN